MKIVKILLLSAMVFGFIACDHKELEQGSQPPFEGAVALKVTNGAITKADGAYWTGDQIGVTAVTPTSMAALYQNVGYATTSTSTTADFAAISEDIYFTDENPASFTAYAPYQATSDVAALPGDNGVISGSTLDQSDFTSLDYLFAEAKSADANLPEVNFTFNHRMAQLIVKVQCFDSSDEDAVSAIRRGTYNLGGLAHDGTFDVTTGEALATGSAVSDWTLTSGTATDEGITYSVILYPQTATMAVSGSIGVSTTFHTTQNVTLEPGYSYTYTIIINATMVETTLVVNGSVVTDWQQGDEWTYEFDGEDDGGDSGDGGDDDTNKIDLSKVTTDGGDLYSYDGTTLTITGNCTVTGGSSSEPYTGKIVVGTAVTALTFDNVHIDTALSTATERIVNISSNLTLTLVGDNYIYLNDDNTTQYEMLYVQGEGVTLTIEEGADGGSLTINDDPDIGTKNNHGALYLDKSNLVINSGTVKATSGWHYAGIGSGYNGSCGDITINGGTVTGIAAGGLGSGIGTGCDATCGTITINGGVVTADCTSGNGAGIGATGSNGTSAKCGDIIILGGTVEATAQGASAAIGTGGNGNTVASSCGKIVIGENVTSVTTNDGNAATCSVGIGGTSNTCTGVFLGATSADDESVTSWTPAEGQFVLNPVSSQTTACGVYGWTVSDGTWTKDK